jgi:ABC-type transport system involved in cytochrome bd biosynthesis fused ATPase/permease subunit
VDETYAPQDLWQTASEDTLQGTLMQNLKNRYEEASQEEASRVLRAAQILHALMENREVEL